MSRLRVYTVHVDLSLPHPYEEARFIEEGFNWRAFVFGPLWALYRQLWLFACLIIGVNCLIVASSWCGMSTLGMACMHVAWYLFIGFTANDWLRGKFRSQGFITADIVTGDFAPACGAAFLRPLFRCR